jgi:hypothetical protein
MRTVSTTIFSTIDGISGLIDELLKFDLARFDKLEMSGQLYRLNQAISRAHMAELRACVLQCVLRDVGGLSVATLSIDDLYLTRAQRTELARRVHPLFQTRGVPGTHDVALGVAVLEALTKPGRVSIPRFDKGQDDRAPSSEWPALAGPCDVVLFEGLWIGLPPMPAHTIAQPINALEAQEDANTVWRSPRQPAAGDPVSRSVLALPVAGAPALDAARLGGARERRVIAELLNRELKA